MMLLDSVRTLARGDITKRAQHYDKTGEFPWENVKAINNRAVFEIPEILAGILARH